MVRLSVWLFLIALLFSSGPPSLHPSLPPPWSFVHRYCIVSGKDLCQLCDVPLLSRPFYTFACTHGFHTDCLTSEVPHRSMPYIPS